MPIVFLTLLETLLQGLAKDLFSNEDIGRYIAMGIAIAESAFNVDARIAALTDHIRQMVAEGRNPTAAEWDALRERSDVAHATIQNWRPGSPT